MPEIPQTWYARSGELSLAYQLLGDGPMEVVVVPQIVSHLELAHELPWYTAFLHSLARFARVVTFDKRDTGMSDRPPGVALLEERVDDLVAVMDTVGMERAAVLGLSEGGTLAVAMAAQHPERVSHLVLFGCAPWYVGDTAAGAFMEPFAEEAMRQVVAQRWGDGTFLRLLAGPRPGHRRGLRSVRAPQHCAQRDAAALGVDAGHRPAAPAARRARPHAGAPARGRAGPAPLEPVPGSAHRRGPAPRAARHRPPPLAGRRGGGGGRGRGAPDRDALAAGTGRRHRPVHGAVHRHRGLHGAAGPPRRPPVASGARCPRRPDPAGGRALPGSGRAHDGRRDPGQLRRAGPRHPLREGGHHRCLRPRAARAQWAAHRGVRAAGRRPGRHHRPHRVTGGVPGRRRRGVGHEHVRDLVFGAGFEFEDRGEHDLRGVPGSWRILAVGGPA